MKAQVHFIGGGSVILGQKSTDRFMTQFNKFLASPGNPNVEAGETYVEDETIADVTIAYQNVTHVLKVP